MNLQALFGVFSRGPISTREVRRPDRKVIVHYAYERADGPVQGYRATRSASAARTDTSIYENPQSISVVYKDAVEDLAPPDCRTRWTTPWRGAGEQLWLQGKWFPCSVCWPGDIIHALSTLKDER